MAATSYPFTISTDTANAKVGDSIEDEIRASAIETALDFYSTAGDLLTVWFKAALSAGDQTLLGTVVAAHLGSDLDAGHRADGVTRVQLTPQGKVGSVLVVSGAGFEAELSPDGTPHETDHHVSFAETRDLQGAFAEVANADPEDEIDLLVTHPNGTVLGVFGETLPIPPSGRLPDVVSEGTTEVPAGIRVTLRYRTKKTAGDKPRISAYLRAHK